MPTCRASPCTPGRTACPWGWRRCRGSRAAARAYVPLRASPALSAPGRCIPAGRGPPEPSRRSRRAARVFGAPQRVVRGVQHLDGVADARLLERPVPLENAVPHVGSPFDGDGAVEIVRDRLHGIAHGGARVLLLEPPAVHVANEEAFGGIAREVLHGRDEVADPV